MSMPWLDRPLEASLASAKQLLRSLRAINKEGVTEKGKQIAM